MRSSVGRSHSAGASSRRAGRSLRAWIRWRAKSVRIARTFQRTGVFPDDTVLDNVMIGLHQMGARSGRVPVLDALLGRSPQISGVNVEIDENRQAELFAALKATPALGMISLRSVALERFRETMAQNMFVMIGVLLAMAGVIAFGVVYNFARISLSEQGREMASLRVLGFSRGEVSMLLLAEIAMVTLLASGAGAHGPRRARRGARRGVGVPSSLTAPGETPGPAGLRRGAGRRGRRGCVKDLDDDDVVDNDYSRP